MIGPIRWGNANKHTPVEVPQVSLHLARLPASFDGFRIALLADLHYGRFVETGFVRKVFQTVARQQVDLVLLCGDMVNHPRPFAARLTEALRQLCPDLPACAVLGNHENKHGAQAFCDACRAAGVEVLVNEHRRIERGCGPAIALAGADEPFEGSPDLPAALGGIQPGTFTILAGHSPDLADRVPRHLQVDLMLCGHTHGGQVCFFGRPILTQVANKKYAAGLVTGPGFPLYISRGLGLIGAPLRVACEPELPIITLRRGPAPA